jgi:hypothetical protein
MGAMTVGNEIGWVRQIRTFAREAEDRTDCVVQVAFNDAVSCSYCMASGDMKN